MDDKIKTTKQCPFCNNEIAIEAKKCKYCKKWIDENKVQEGKIEAKVTQSDNEIETKLCVFCGEKIPLAAKKCRYCKNWVVELEERTEKQKDLPKTKQCPYCLQEIPYKAQKCSHCLSDVEILTPSSSQNLRTNLDKYEQHKIGTCFKCGYNGLLGVVQEVKPFKMGFGMITIGIIVTISTVGIGIVLLVLGFIVQKYQKKYHCTCPNCGNSIMVGRN